MCTNISDDYATSIFMINQQLLSYLQMGVACSSEINVNIYHITSQKTVIFRVAAVRTWNLKYLHHDDDYSDAWLAIHVQG
jgi:hypothetical protein